MRQNHHAPTAEQFPRPPVSFSDGDDRPIIVEAGDDQPVGVEGSDGRRTALAEMYAAFGSKDRAQGIPPVGERRIERWLDRLSAGITVVAWHGEDAVGHAVLMPMDDGRHELSVFVHPGYRGAGIGSELLAVLFGLGRERGVERVWLSVQRSNQVARNLYRSLGFETVASGLEQEMELAL